MIRNRLIDRNGSLTHLEIAGLMDNSHTKDEENANALPSSDEVTPMALRNIIAFYIAGLCNNSSYVIMLAGAKSIDPSMVG